jgi:predicted secreted protein
MQQNFITGNEFTLFDIEDNAIAYSKSCALSVKQKLIDTTTKSDNGWAKSIIGSRDFSIRFNGLVSFNEEFNLKYFNDRIITGEPFFIRFGVKQEDFDYSFYGEVSVESININADQDEAVNFEGVLKGVGELNYTNEGTPEQSGYIKAETDPVFRGSAAYTITNQNKLDWTNAANKIFQSVEGEVIEGEVRQIKLIFGLKDGSKYSTQFPVGTNSGGSNGDGTINTLSFANGILTVNNKSISLDNRYQTIGDYVTKVFLSTNHYTKTEADAKYYLATNPDGFIKSSYVDNNFYNRTQSDSRYLQAENDTLDSVAGRGNSTTYDLITSGKLEGNSGKFNTLLSIPKVAPDLNGSGGEAYFYFGLPASNGIPSTGGGGSSTLAQLLDVTLSSPASGQSLVFNGSKWINKIVTVDLSNYLELSSAATIPTNANFAIGYDGVRNFIQSHSGKNLDLNPEGNSVTIGGKYLGDFIYRNSITGSEIVSGYSQPPSTDIGVSQMLRWKNYGNGHVIFDASQGTSPSGTNINNTNAQQNWSQTYPTLMGWNGVSTYGVRVDSARTSDTWGGRSADLTTYQPISSLGILGVSADGVVRLSGQQGTRDFLALGSGAYSEKTQLWSATHPNDYYISNSWDGIFWQLKSNHGSPVNVGHSDNSTLLDGFARSIDATAYGIVQRDVNGYINSNYFRSTRGEDNITAAQYLFDSGDGYIRKKNVYATAAEITGVSRHWALPNHSDGVAYHNGTLELVNNVTRPSLGLHWAGVVASTISIEASGRIAIMNNPGTSYENLIANQIISGADIQATTFVSANNYVTGGRVWSGYDSGVAGAISANNWFRSSGQTGWINDSYGGGIYMVDSSWLRTYGSKNFYCDREIQATTVRVNNNLIIPSAPPVNPEGGVAYFYFGLPN